MGLKCKKGEIYTLVTCGRECKPPHDDEKRPPKCSRVRGFCLVPGEMAPDWACWQHGGSRYVVVDKPRRFANCEDAVKTLNKEVQDGVYEGGTRTAVALIPNSFKYTRKKPNGKYIYKTTIHAWRVISEETTIILPDITWSDMTPADIAAVKEARDALLEHEKGHVALAEEYADTLTDQTRGEEIECSDLDQDTARAELEQAINARADDENDKLLAKQEKYDTKTEHGAKQSKVGGKDVQLNCP